MTPEYMMAAQLTMLLIKNSFDTLGWRKTRRLVERMCETLTPVIEESLQQEKEERGWHV